MVRQHLDWLGTAQLQVGGSCPVRYNDLSHHQKQSLAFLTICQLDGTCNWWLLLPVFLHPIPEWSWSILSRWQAWGECMEVLVFPISQDSPISSFWCGPMERIRISPVLIGIREAAGIARSIFIEYICLRGSHPGFSVRVYSLSLFFSWTNRQWGFSFRVTPLAVPLLRYPEGNGSIYP